MKFNSILSFHTIVILILLSVFGPTSTFGQQNTKAPADSTTIPIKAYKMSEVSIKSAENWTKISREYESLLADDKIAEMKMKNDSVLNYINSLLIKDLVFDLSSKNIRYLNNKKVFWKNYNDLLDVEKTALASNIKILNKYKHDFEDEILVWENTKDAIKEEDAEPTVVNRIVELVSKIEGIINKIQGKNDIMLTMLDKTSEESVDVIDFINLIDKALIEKQSEVFMQDQPMVIFINLTKSSIWTIKEPLLFFYEMEVVSLLNYLSEYLSLLIFQIFLILAMIIAFRFIYRRMLSASIYGDSIYRKMLGKMLSRTVSAALILGLFASIIIFPNRPELFKDIAKLLVIIPLIILTSTFIDKKFIKYFYLFGVIIYLQFIYTVFPPDNIYSTLVMIIVGLIEIISLWRLLVYFYKNKVLPNFLNNLVVILLTINTGFALVGLVGVLYGTTMLAEIALNIPVANALSGILVIITAIIFNGLVEVAVESEYFQKLNVIRRYGKHIATKTIGAINLLAIILWGSTMMSVINLKTPILTWLVGVFTNEISVGSASFTLWDIVLFFLVIWLSVLISKMIRILLEEDILRQFKLSKGVPHTIAMMVRYSIITIGILLAVTAAGIPVDNLTVMFGAFGVGIGFGLQNIFNNIVSGFILLFERPIQIGDTIEVGQLQLTGVVKTIGVRSSNIRTFDGAEVIVPNGQLISNEVVNWTLSDRRRRIEIIAGVAYGSNPHKVRELLLKILKTHPDIINDPEPIVLFNALGDSSLDFRMLFWTSNSSEWIRIRSEVMFDIHDTLQKEGISIPFPQMDLHLRSVDDGVDVNKGSGS